MQQTDLSENIESVSTLNSLLDNYLSNTRLSMSQVATKLKISKGHLSDIKNRKITPGLNLGIKILRLCKAEPDNITD